MRNKKFLSLLVITLIMVAALIYIEKKDAQQQESQADHLDFNPESIHNIFLERGSEQINLTKDANGWRFSAGSIGADKEYVKDLIQKIAETDFQPVSMEADQSQDTFHFEKPAAKIFLTDDQEHRTRLIMSEKKNFEGHAYFKINDDPRLYIGASDIDTWLMNRVIYFQHKHLFAYDISSFDQINIKSLNNRFELTAPFNKEKILVLLTKLRNMTVQSYLQTQEIHMDEQVISVRLSSEKTLWDMRLSLNSKYKKLYAEIIDGKSHKIEKYYVEFDPSYWEYFANLNPKSFIEEKK